MTLAALTATMETRRRKLFGIGKNGATQDPGLIDEIDRFTAHKAHEPWISNSFASPIYHVIFYNFVSAEWATLAAAFRWL
jgi:hypothetical protein